MSSLKDWTSLFPFLFCTFMLSRLRLNLIPRFSILKSPAPFLDKILALLPREFSSQKVCLRSTHPYPGLFCGWGSSSKFPTCENGTRKQRVEHHEDVLFTLFQVFLGTEQAFFFAKEELKGETIGFPIAISESSKTCLETPSLSTNEFDV